MPKSNQHIDVEQSEVLADFVELLLEIKKYLQSHPEELKKSAA